MSGLAGRVAIVTGASRGIGLAIADTLETGGAKVVRVARSLRDAASKSRLEVPCDLTDPAQVDRLAQRVQDHFGVPDVVISSSGTFLLRGFESTDVTQFDGQIAANLTAPFLLAKAFLPAMRERATGRLILIGSVADHRAFAENSAYSAAKFGLRGLHQVLREEYRGTGVLISLVSPGPTDTAVWDPIDPDHREGFLPRAKMLRPADVAGAVSWIASQPDHVDVDWLRLGPAA